MKNIHTYLRLIYMFPTKLSETAPVYRAISTVFSKYEGEIVTTLSRAIEISNEIIVDELHIDYMNMSKRDNRMINRVFEICGQFFGNKISRQLKQYYA